MKHTPRRAITGAEGEWTPWFTPTGLKLRNGVSADRIARANERTYPSYTPRRAL